MRITDDVSYVSGMLWIAAGFFLFGIALKIMADGFPPPCRAVARAIARAWRRHQPWRNPYRAYRGRHWELAA